MEVSKESQKNPIVLSNFEVFKLINELKAQTTQNQASSHLATILYEASHYLQDAPCAKQTESEIENLLKDLSNFPAKLTKMEKLMIVNYPPKSTAQLPSMIKDIEERLSEEQMEELLEIIAKHIGSSIDTVKK